MAAQSKSFQTFTNRLLHFDADIELVDILDFSIKDGLLAEKEEKLFEKIDSKKHPVLSKRTVSHHNQLLAMNHLRQTVFAAYIKDVYEEVYSYLKSMLSEAAVRAKIEPERFIGEHRASISVADILKAEQLQNVIEQIVSSMFRSLENERSTASLIEKSCNKLGISVDKKIREQAIYYLEIRHQLVHADGKADEAFKSKHSDLTYTEDNYIDLRFKLIQKIRSAVYRFVEEFDKQSISQGLVLPHT